MEFIIPAGGLATMHFLLLTVYIAICKGVESFENILSISIFNVSLLFVLVILKSYKANPRQNLLIHLFQNSV